MAINPIQFQAHWFPENEHLKETFDSKIKSIVYDIFSIIIPVIGLCRLGRWALSSICRLAILPSSLACMDMDRAKESFWSSNPYRNHFNMKPVELYTPDGVKLSAVLYQYKPSVLSRIFNKFFQNTEQFIPTIITFLPNAAIMYEDPFRTLLEQLQKEDRECDVLIFDYRGCGESQGKASASNQLILDGETAYQFVRDAQKVPEENIYFFGWSLGGGCSAEVKAMHPKSGKYISDRSFRSMAAEIQALTITPLAWLAKLAGWTSFNAKAAFQKMGSSASKMVLYHEKDGVIPKRAQLQQALVPKEDVLIKQLYFPFEEDNGNNIRGDVAHCTGLNAATIIGEKGSAIEKVTEFYFSRRSLFCF